jgi:hypothetical protein
MVLEVGIQKSSIHILSRSLGSHLRAMEKGIVEDLDKDKVSVSERMSANIYINCTLFTSYGLITSGPLRSKRRNAQ